MMVKREEKKTFLGPGEPFYFNATTMSKFSFCKVFNMKVSPVARVFELSSKAKQVVPC
jgi:hypothetical protein